MREEGSGVVYIVIMLGAFRIGSTVNLEARMKAHKITDQDFKFLYTHMLRKKIPFEISGDVCLYWMDKVEKRFEVEARLHKLLAPYRISNSYYKVTAHSMKIIEDFKKWTETR